MLAGAFSLATLNAMAPPRIFKTHAAWPQLPTAGCTPHGPHEDTRVVVVVRDPRDVCVSLYYHSRSIRGTSRGYEPNPAPLPALLRPLSLAFDGSSC